MDYLVLGIEIPWLGVDQNLGISCLGELMGTLARLEERRPGITEVVSSIDARCRKFFRFFN